MRNNYTLHHTISRIRHFIMSHQMRDYIMHISFSFRDYKNKCRTKVSKHYMPRHIKEYKNKWRTRHVKNFEYISWLNSIQNDYTLHYTISSRRHFIMWHQIRYYALHVSFSFKDYKNKCCTNSKLQNATFQDIWKEYKNKWCTRYVKTFSYISWLN